MENRNPRNCVFSRKFCLLLCQQTPRNIKIITWLQLNHPSFPKLFAQCTVQDLGRMCSILLFVTCTINVYQVRHCVTGVCCVKNGRMGVVLCETWSENLWTLLLRYLTVSNMLWMIILSFYETVGQLYLSLSLKSKILVQDKKLM